ncbi:MAG: YfhO family protein, partial [Bacteroidales bacterium]|nr:YfhO family protein [Bacteroidales bacterium]
LCFFDLLTVDKRYLSSNDFVAKKSWKNPFPATVADQMIAQDTTLYYRVFNQAVDPFNDATASFRHKSVGGYHAAKLRRYQDLITHQLSKGNMQVFNMLNTKYFIVPNQQTNQPIAMLNPDALGNAWFVDQIKWVNTPDEEMNSMNDFNPLQTAIINNQFGKEIGKTVISPKDSLSSIELTAYAANKLVFKAIAKKDEIAIFSDIYYPGWKATIDGKETPIACANYVLRALPVPAGEHVIEFVFDPVSIYVTETIAYSSMIILLLAVITYACSLFLRKRNAVKIANK